jgi:hypothetical protein
MSRPTEPPSDGEDVLARVQSIFDAASGGADTTTAPRAQPAPAHREPEPEADEPGGAPPAEHAATEPAAPAATEAALAAIVGDVHAQLDELRDQLERAFAEVDVRFGELHVWAKRAATQSPPPAPEPPPATDLTPVLELVEKRAEALAHRIADSHAELRIDLERLHRSAPADTAGDLGLLDERIRTTGIELASDIAQVSAEVSRLARSVEAQESLLADLRATVDLLKRRLL